MNTKSNENSNRGIHASVASHLEKSTQFQKYHNIKSGHGFAAEDSNALDDFLSGKKVEKIGENNVCNGADRIVMDNLFK